MKATLNLKVN